MSDDVAETASPPALLCAGVLDRLVEATGSAEIRAAGAPPGQPWRTLHSTMTPDPVGVVRLFRGTRVAHVVHIGLTVPAIGLDSHMVFAFGHADDALPHFTLDSVASDTGHAFHLDLVPRVDLATHLDYLDHVYTPLTPWYERGRALPGLSAAAVGPRQRAVMSPWMLVHRADEDAFAAIGPVVDAYLDHWLALVAAPLPDAVSATLADTDLAARDRALRAVLFDPDVDPVWHRVARLIGAKDTDIARNLLTHGPDAGDDDAVKGTVHDRH